MFTKTLTTGLVKSLTYATVIMSVGLLSACSETAEETKASTDFATSAIQAHYSVEVSEAHKVIYKANFLNDKNSLVLEGGDQVTITSISSEKIPLVESITASIATYSLTRTEGSDPSRPFFDFTRPTQDDATTSVVVVPSGFVMTSPTASTANYVPSDGKQFTITWLDTDSSIPTVDDNEEFTLRYDFKCRHTSGTPSIDASFAEKAVDNGTHVVNLVNILGASDYQSCSQFDIIAIRSNSTTGYLAPPIGSGSVVGSQVRTITGSLSRLLLK